MKVKSIVRGLVNHAKRVTDVALNRVTAGRQATVFPDDVFIISYPKSGNTWTRFLIGNLIYQDQPVTWANVELLVPSIYAHSNRKLLKLPRIFKSHECFDPRCNNVICIVRDPRDVVVSIYYYSIKIGAWPEASPLEDFVPKLISGEFRSGLVADPTWGSWHDNVASWLAMRDNRKFLLLRYEDMIEDPQRELARVAGFLKIPATLERLARAIELSSADNMRKLESSQSKEWTLTLGKKMRQDIPFVRAAKSGGWKTALTPKSVAQIEVAWGKLMRELGYELTNQPNA
jgi:Sulfotransferase domain